MYNYLKPSPLPSRYSHLCSGSPRGPPLDVKQEKDCQDDSDLYNYLEPVPPTLQVLLPPTPAALGAPPFDVKPGKVCKDDDCDMYNYLKPVSLPSR